MEEMIIVVGTNKHKVGQLRRWLRQHGYYSIPYNSAEHLVDELNILPTCNINVPLVIIELEILKDINENLIEQLANHSLQVPFLLLNKPGTQTNLMNIFEDICQYRMQFRLEQNPDLAGILEDAGVEIGCTGGIING